MQILQCVPNFSEGRDPAFLEALKGVLGKHAVKLLDLAMDKDHNRSEVNFLGAPEAVEEAALAVASCALDLIDMRQHKGSHPRMGAVDVVPFIPVRGVTMAEAVELARRFGRAFAEAHQIPVFFYEEACTSEARRHLGDIRKSEYEGMLKKLQDPAWRVDAGPQRVNERWGVTAVGARMPLVAFNVQLHSGDLDIAKQVANAVRSVGGGLRYVKAVGLPTEEPGVVQIAMTIENYRRTPLHRALELIRAEAARYGVAVKWCGFSGMVPIEALEEVVSYYLQIPGFHSRQIIEYHLLPE